LRKKIVEAPQRKTKFVNKIDFVNIGHNYVYYKASASNSEGHFAHSLARRPGTDVVSDDGLLGRGVPF
jgi:hypothetical protein